MPNQRVIVTGGTGGLGRAVVAALLAADYAVSVTYNVRAEWDALQHEPGMDIVQGLEVNLLDEGSVQAALREVEGPVYGVVNLAGGFAMGAVHEMSLMSWNNLMALNLTTLLLMTKHTLPQMRAANAGRIIAVSSAAMLQAPAQLAAYNVSKRGVLTLVETLAHELQDTAITANAILPGTLDTPANRGSVPANQRVPLGRVSSVIRWLLSAEAAGVTGAAIPITLTGAA